MLTKQLLAEVSVFVPVEENPQELRLYSYLQWKALHDGMSKEERDILLAKSSSMVQPDTLRRVLLPQGITWRKVTVSGKVDYISIVEAVPEKKE
jgi:hypothetical protein